MCDKELLVSYVYDELQGAERRAFQHHLTSCGACREEVQALRATRGQVASWTVPERALGLTITPPDPVRAGRVRLASGWGLAAAAALVLALASLVAHVEVTFVDDGVTLRAGRASAVPAGTAVPVADPSSRDALAALQQQVRQLESRLASQQAASRELPAVRAPAASTAPGAAVDDPALLRRVQQLIRDSEGRQQQQLARGLLQVMRELQASHTRDVMRVEQAINQTQGVWGDEMVRQREEMKQFYRLVNQQR